MISKFKMNVTVLIIATLILGLGGLAFITYHKTRELLVTNLEQSMVSLTYSSGSEVGLWLKARKSEMELMANSPLIQSGNKEAIISYLNAETQRNKVYEQFFVADQQGNYFMNSSQTGSVADREYFQKVMATGDTVISDPLISRGSGNQIIVVAAPIKKGREVIGLIGGNVNLKDLTEIVAKVAPTGQKGYAYMVQEDGLIITHPDANLMMKYNPLKEKDSPPNLKSAVQKMIQSESGVTRYMFQGVDKYMAFAPVPGIKWSLGVTVPVQYVTAQLHYLPFYFIAVALLFGIGSAIFLSRWLVIPLKKLSEFTTDITGKLHNEATIECPKSPVFEVDSLIRNFRNMVFVLRDNFQTINSTNLNLENEISQRTKAQEMLEQSYEELAATEEELRSNFIELQAKEKALSESESRFRSMLENVNLITVIIGKDGCLNFCNDFMLKLTGFEREEVIGQDYFQTFLPSGIQGKARERFLDDFKRKGHTLHLTSYIQTKDGQKRLVNWNNTILVNAFGDVIGIASIGEDITERKQIEEKLVHLSWHDALTGLYNRTYFEEEMRRLKEDNCSSVGVVMCDVDGLKLVNDTLGHITGDQLLQLAAGIIRKCFREEDVIARIGGDEFAVIMPESELHNVEQACRRVQTAVATYNEENPEFPLSLSVGFAVSNKTYGDLGDIFKEADNNMYREKLHRSKSTRSALVHTLMKALEARDFITEGHAERLQNVVFAVGEAIGISERKLADLRLLAQFHDIGKVGIPDRILFKPEPLTREEFIEMQRHSEIGFRIAQSAPDLVPVADWILKHHEWWNGQGYPLGLNGEDIPLECRLLAIADAYDAMTSDRPYRQAMSHEDAVLELMRKAGIQFDPNLVPVFIEVIETTFFALVSQQDL